MKLSGRGGHAPIANIPNGSNIMTAAHVSLADGKLMPALYDRLTFDLDHARIRNSDTTVDDVIELIESSKTPLQVVTGLGMEGTDLVAAFAYAALGGPDSLGLPLIQGEPSRPDVVDGLREASLAILYPRTPKPIRLALAAGLLQVFDFWEESHIAAQEADDLGERGSSAYWHAIIHRREPDHSNAEYWLRRMGKHPILPLVADQAGALIQESGLSWASRLVSEGRWEPVAFLHACRAAAPGSPDETLARRLQRIEMLVLLEFSLHDLI